MASVKSSYVSGGMPIASNLLLYFFNLSSSSKIFDASPMRRRASKYPKARAYGGCQLRLEEEREDLAIRLGSLPLQPQLPSPRRVR